MDKKITKYFIAFVIASIFFVSGSVFSVSLADSPVKSALQAANVSNSALVGVSFKELKTGKVKFEKNSKTPMSPASVQKIVTIIPSLNTLGKDYKFRTRLYKKGSNLYLKLGADPYLTSRDLRGMLSPFNKYDVKSIDNFYIDDSIMDREEWGEGWQWDNELNVLMPKFSAYNLDGNLIRITFFKTNSGSPAEVKTSVFYPLTVENNVLTGNENTLKLERKNYISPYVLCATGTISKDTDVVIPVNNTKKYFILRLEDAIRKQKVPFYNNFKFAPVPKDAQLVAEVTHDMDMALNDILKKSNNMIAETVYKLAGGKFSGGEGSAAKAAKMSESYYTSKGITCSDIKTTDGSGVSKNNLLTADFITEVLLKDYNNSNSIKDYMTSPGEDGTLQYRMLYFQDNLKAKTGTLTNVSALAGYFTAKSGKTYAFAILINDPKSKSADKKAFEEYLLRNLYKSL